MQLAGRATVIMGMRRKSWVERSVALFLLVALQAGASSAEAERWAKQPGGEWHAVEERGELPSVFEADSKVRLFGVTLFGGLPDGVVSGISIHPGTNLLRFDIAVTSLLSFGVRAGATFDPFDWVLAPTLTVAGGYSAWAKIPSTEPQYQLYYLNIQPGLELGRRSRFRVFVRAGYSHLWAASRSPATFQGVRVTSQPRLRIDVFPTVNLGVTAYFGQ
jgi:hypothetical protein